MHGKAVMRYSPPWADDMHGKAVMRYSPFGLMMYGRKE